MRTRLTLLHLVVAVLLLIGVISSTACAEADHLENSKIIQVVAGDGFSLGLHADGTVACAGHLPEKCKAALASWQDISRLELYGWPYIIGYRESGLSLATTVDLDRWPGYGTTEVNWAGENFDTWTDVVSVKITPNFIAGLRKDGTVLTRTGGRSDRVNLDSLDTSDWRDITGIYLYNNSCLIGLKKDGSVETNDEGTLNYQWNIGHERDKLTEWNGIERIQTDYSIAVFGFRNDGTLLGASFIDGSFPGNMPLTGPWDNMKEVFIGTDSVFGLRRDGTVAAGYNPDDPRLIEVTQWKNIRQLSYHGVEMFLPVGLHDDGTVEVVNSYKGKPYGEWDVSGWRDVEKLFTGSEFLLGLKKDGTVLATGGEFGTLDGIHEAESWTDIIDIAHSNQHILGLKKDGTVVALGKNDQGQCNVADWLADSPINY